MFLALAGQLAICLVDLRAGRLVSGVSGIHRNQGPVRLEPAPTCKGLEVSLCSPYRSVFQWIDRDWRFSTPAKQFSSVFTFKDSPGRVVSEVLWLKIHHLVRVGSPLSVVSEGPSGSASTCRGDKRKSGS